MTEIYIVLGGVVLAIATGIALYFFGKKSGADAVRTDVANKEANDARVAGQVMAEHRDDDDTSRRLGDGNF